MLCDIEPDGRMHDGLDDAWNTARLIEKLEKNPNYKLIYRERQEPVSYTHLDVYKRQTLCYGNENRNRDLEGIKNMELRLLRLSLIHILNRLTAHKTVSFQCLISGSFPDSNVHLIHDLKGIPGAIFLD